MATLDAVSKPLFEGFNTNRYIDQDLVELTYDGGDRLIIMGSCSSDPVKFGYNKKVDLYGNVTQEHVSFKQSVDFKINDMTNEQYLLLQSHWLKDTSVKIKDEKDKVYSNLIIVGERLALSDNTDVDGNIYWTGNLKLEQK